MSFHWLCCFLIPSVMATVACVSGDGAQETAPESTPAGTSSPTPRVTTDPVELQLAELPTGLRQLAIGTYGPAFDADERRMVGLLTQILTSQAYTPQSKPDESELKTLVSLFPEGVDERMEIVAGSLYGPETGFPPLPATDRLALLASPIVDCFNPAYDEKFPHTFVNSLRRYRASTADYYTQCRESNSVMILAPAVVDPEALSAVARVVDEMLTCSTREVRDSVVKAAARVMIIPYGVPITDLPGFNHRTEEILPSGQELKDVRGLADFSDTFVGEESILDLPGNLSPPQATLVHELGHVVKHALEHYSLEHSESSIPRAYEAAMDAGLWHGTYAATNDAEFFAEMVQIIFGRASYFGATSVDGADALKAYDPRTYASIVSLFPCFIQ